MSTALKLSKKAASLSGGLMSTAEIADGVSTGGVNRFSTKGKVWRLKLAGNDDEVKMGQAIDVVILGRSPERGLAHQFYETGYTDGSAEPPSCSSQDGIRPDSWIEHPVSDTCSNCPNQVWGSRMTDDGRKAKLCSDHIKLYVKLAKDINDDNAPVIMIVITVNSQKALANYSKDLAKQGISSPSLVVTTIEFDDDASVPKLVFEAKAVVADKHLDSIITIAEEKPWDVPVNQPAIAAPKAEKRALPEYNPDADTVTTSDDDDDLGGW